MQSRGTAGVLVMAALTAALPADAADLGRAKQPVVYGDDDRIEVYEATDPVLKRRAERSLVAFVDARSVEYRLDDFVELEGPSLAAAYLTCSGERFAEQPTAAHCTGTLIDDDLVLTAGHCLGPTPEFAQEACREVALVFGYLYEAPGRLLALSSADVFRCRRVVAWARGADANQDLEDYAIIQLDRAATPEREVAPADTGPLEVGQRVSVMGFGAGLPAKIDQGAEITDVSTFTHYFGATTDTFGGNSGSPIFNAQGSLVGVHVRGQPDWNVQDTCQRVARPDSGFEDQQRVADPLGAICESEWPSERLCGIAPRCGDAVCSPSEGSDVCPEDCPPAACGDGVCEGAEPVECKEDCEGPQAPDGWTCNPDFYRDRAGCDCGCGAWDLDCADPQEVILNCEDGQWCDGQGLCRSGDDGGDGCQLHPVQGSPLPSDGRARWWWLLVLACVLVGSRRIWSASGKPRAG